MEELKYFINLLDNEIVHADIEDSNYLVYEKLILDCGNDWHYKCGWCSSEGFVKNKFFLNLFSYLTKCKACEGNGYHFDNIVINKVAHKIWLDNMTIKPDLARKEAKKMLRSFLKIRACFYLNKITNITIKKELLDAIFVHKCLSQQI